MSMTIRSDDMTCVIAVENEAARSRAVPRAAVQRDAGQGIGNLCNSWAISLTEEAPIAVLWMQYINDNRARELQTGNARVWSTM